MGNTLESPVQRAVVRAQPAVVKYFMVTGSLGTFKRRCNQLTNFIRQRLPRSKQNERDDPEGLGRKEMNRGGALLGKNSADDNGTFGNACETPPESTD
jgi:hypothetical protein